MSTRGKTVGLADPTAEGVVSKTRAAADVDPRRDPSGRRQSADRLVPGPGLFQSVLTPAGRPGRLRSRGPLEPGVEPHRAPVGRTARRRLIPRTDGVGRAASPDGVGETWNVHGPVRFFEVDPVDELERILVVRPQRFRLQFFAVAADHGPAVLTETEMEAADASGAIRDSAGRRPPRAVGRPADRRAANLPGHNGRSANNPVLGLAGPA